MDYYKLCFNQTSDSLSKLNDSILFKLHSCSSNSSTINSTLQDSRGLLDNKTLLSVTVTILIFAIGLLIQWIIRKSDKKVNVNLVKTVISIWIEQIKPLVVNQAKECRKFALTLRGVQSITPVKLKFHNITSEKVNEIKLETLINSFIKNTEGDEIDNAKDLFSIIRGFEYFNAIKNHIVEQHKLFQEDTLSIIEKWNDGLMKLNALTIEIETITLNPPDQGFREFANSYMEIRANWMKLGNQNTAQTTFDIMIQPLLDCVRTELSRRNISPQIIKCGEICFNLKIVFDQWENNKKQVSDFFLGIAIAHIKTYKILERANRKNKLKSNKSWWRLS